MDQENEIDFQQIVGFFENNHIWDDYPDEIGPHNVKWMHTYFGVVPIEHRATESLIRLWADEQRDGKHFTVLVYVTVKPMLNGREFIGEWSWADILRGRKITQYIILQHGDGKRAVLSSREYPKGTCE